MSDIFSLFLISRCSSQHSLNFASHSVFQYSWPNGFLKLWDLGPFIPPVTFSVQMFGDTGQVKMIHLVVFKLQFSSWT